MAGSRSTELVRAVPPVLLSCLLGYILITAGKVSGDMVSGAGRAPSSVPNALVHTGGGSRVDTLWSPG